jgi:hypothetical protein
MGKRFLITLVAMMSLGAIWWTDAEAQTCLKWITSGGSGMCAAWSTKGVQVELTYKQDCGPFGATCQAEATATAEPGNAVALCKNALTGEITQRECVNQVSFFGQRAGCDPGDAKHEQDNTGTGGAGHNKGKHGGGCKATIILEPFGPPACAECGTVCEPTTDGVCVDVTPVEMDTLVSATNAFGGDFELTAAQAESSCTGSACVFAQHCSINPKKIEFFLVEGGEGEVPPIPPGARYQCNLTCVGNECFPEGD